MLAPQPGLEDLDDLVARTRAAGLPAPLRVDGDPVAGFAGAQPVRIQSRAGGADERAQARRTRHRRGLRALAPATRSSSR